MARFDGLLLGLQGFHSGVFCRFKPDVETKSRYAKTVFWPLFIHAFAIKSKPNTLCINLRALCQGRSHRTSWGAR